MWNTVRHVGKLVLALLWVSEGCGGFRSCPLSGLAWPRLLCVERDMAPLLPPGCGQPGWVTGGVRWHRGNLVGEESVFKKIIKNGLYQISLRNDFNIVGSSLGQRCGLHDFSPCLLQMPKCILWCFAIAVPLCSFCNGFGDRRGILSLVLSPSLKTSEGLTCRDLMRYLWNYKLVFGHLFKDTPTYAFQFDVGGLWQPSSRPAFASDSIRDSRVVKSVLAMYLFLSAMYKPPLSHISCFQVSHKPVDCRCQKWFAISL